LSTGCPHATHPNPLDCCSSRASQELHQLTTNLVTKTLRSTDIQVDDIATIVNHVEESIGADLSWDQGTFRDWFLNEFGHLYASAEGSTPSTLAEESTWYSNAIQADSPHKLGGSPVRFAEDVNDDTEYDIDDAYPYGYDADHRPHKPPLDVIQHYFEQYDLDGSGSINSLEELLMLATNVVVSGLPGLEIDADVITEKVESFTMAVDLVANPMDLETFAEWLFAAFNFSELDGFAASPVACPENGFLSMGDDYSPKTHTGVGVGLVDVSLHVGEAVVEEEEEDQAEGDSTVDRTQMGVVRRCCLSCYNLKWFEPFINAVVIINCVTLASVDVQDPDATINEVLEVCETTFLVIFTLEMLIKLIALTPCSGTECYFNDNWNIMDFCIVCSGWPTLFMGSGSTTIIRTVRVVKPLRTISHIRELNVILDSLTQSGAKLVPVMGLFTFVFMIFGTVGLQLFQGVMNQRCYYPYNVTTNIAITNIHTVIQVQNISWKMDETNERLCGGNYNCPGSQECIISEITPNFSITNFNNFGNAMLTFFVAITMEGWVDVMYQVQDAYSYFMSTFYFIFIILITSMTVMELAKGVIQNKYSKLAIETLEEEEESHRQLMLHKSTKIRSLICMMAQFESCSRVEVWGVFYALVHRWKAANDLYDPQDNLADVAYEEESNYSDCSDQEEDELLGGDEDEGGRGEEASAEMEDLAESRDMAEKVKKFKQGTIRISKKQKEKLGNPFMYGSKSGNATTIACKKLVNRRRFEKGVIWCVVANTFVLMMDYMGEDTVCYTTGPAAGHCILQAVKPSASYQLCMDILNIIFLGIFTTEMVLKVVAYGIFGYASSTMRIVDAVTVMAGYVGMALDGNSSLTAIRCLRLARVFRLTRAYPALQVMLDSIFKSGPSCAYFLIFLLLYVYLSSVGGMQLFGGKFRPPYLEDTPRSTYDTFFWGCLSTFQILTGENWNEILYNGIVVRGYGAALYFVFVVIVGDCVILNLFLAVVLCYYEGGAPEGLDPGKLLESLKDMGCCPCMAVAAGEEIGEELDGGNEEVWGEIGWNEKSEQDRGTGAIRAFMHAYPQVFKEFHAEEDLPDEMQEGQRVEVFRNEADKGQAWTFTQMAQLRKDRKELKRAMQSGCLKQRDDDPEPVPYRSLFIFEQDDHYRLWCLDIVTQPWFDNGVLILIFISSIVLIFDADPKRDPKEQSTSNDIIAWLNVLFTTAFTLEMTLKVIAYGFMMHPGAYLRDSWNVLDFTVVCASIAAVKSDSSAIKTLRVIRTLRPLRAIKRAPSLKVVVDALLDCVPGFINVGMVVCMVYLVFAIVGVQFFAGRFWKCNDASVRKVEECIGLYQVAGSGVNATREWSNSIQNFDNFFVAFLTLFEIASLEMWLDPMHDGMDVPQELGYQPELNQAWYFAWFFVVFVIIGGFTVINLFVGVVCENFHDARRENMGLPCLTETQAEFIEAIEGFKSGTVIVRPSPPGIDSRCLPLRAWAYKIVQYDLKGEGDGTFFDAAITAVIYANCVVMGMYFWEPPVKFPSFASEVYVDPHGGFTNGLEVCNKIFACIFIMEMLLKITGLGLSQYLSDGWNKFDGILVIVSLVVGLLEIFASDNALPLPPSLPRIVRTLRVIRIVRTLRGMREVMRLVETLARAMPAVTNVIGLMGLVIYIYALLGMSFFGKLPLNAGPNNLLNEHANFQDFHTACITLFRMSTGESWNGIMHDCMKFYPQAWVYFVTYIIIGAYMILNLLIAIVMETFQNVMDAEDSLVKPMHINYFLDVWSAFDPEQFAFIDAGQLRAFFKLLEGEIWPPHPGLGPHAKKAAVEALIETVPCTHDGKVHLVELFVSMLKAVYGAEEIDILEAKALKTTMLDLVTQYPSLYRNDLSILDMGRDKGGVVVRYLEGLGINKTDAQQYSAIMADNGVDSPADVLEMTPGMLDIYGFKPVHKDKVKNAIRLEKSRKKFAQVPL